MYGYVLVVVNFTYMLLILSLKVLCGVQLLGYMKNKHC